MSKRRKRLLWLAALLLLLACTVAGQQRLQVSEYDCPVAGLPAGFENFRILQLSDLHGARFGRQNERLLRTVAKQRPDMIVLTGDFIEELEDLEVTAELLPQLAGLAPCYFVSGNHEWACGGMAVLAEQLRSAGVRYLANEYTLLSRDGESLLLCGVEDPNSWADLITPEKLVAQAQLEYPGLPIVLLGHRNYWVERYPALPVELIFCGHGHGGAIRIPGVGGLLGTERLLFPEFEDGVHASGSYHMVVSRGLGRIYGLPRIFNKPEIVVGTLKKEA